MPTRLVGMSEKQLGLYRDNGKENGNCSDYVGVILGLYTDNGNENGNYSEYIGVILGLYEKM